MAEFFESLKFGQKHLLWQTGATWGCLVYIQLSQYWKSVGITNFKPSRLLQNALESVFSIVSSFQSNPSACHVIMAFKKIIVSNFMANPIRGSYTWDDDTVFDDKNCFLTLLKKRKVEKMKKKLISSILIVFKFLN